MDLHDLIVCIVFSTDFMLQKYQPHFNFCTKMASFIVNLVEIKFFMIISFLLFSAI